MCKSYLKYWGKARRNDDGESYHLLVYHSLDVAGVGSVLLDKHPTLSLQLSKLTGLSKDEFKQWAVFFLALHDIGKFADSFQNLVPEVLKQLQQRSSDNEYSIRHDSLGYLLWNEELKKHFSELGIMPAKLGKRGTTPPEQQAIDSWMGAVTGHHGEPPQNIQRRSNQYFEETLDFPAVKEYVTDAHHLFCKNNSFPDCDKEKLELASWWLAGFAVLCDWLGSNKKYFPYCTEEMPLKEYWTISTSQAERAIAGTGLLGATPTNKLTLHQIIQANDSEIIEATPLQEMAQNTPLQDSSYLFILEDVTGAGKTEAAVILAHRLMQQDTINGVYFALPTMATANAMYSRMSVAYQNFYEVGSKPSLVLAHGASKLSEKFSQSIMPVTTTPKDSNGDGTETAEAHCNQWLADNRKKSLLADIGVGTIDQALLAILPSRHQSLRLLGLLNKVLIVDEVHACDAYTHELLCALLKAHAASGGSAILLSATLPESQRQKLVNAYAEGKKWQTASLLKTGLNDYPLMTSFNNKGIQECVVETRETVKRTVEVKLIHAQNEIENLFSKVIKKGQCACWVRNTVVDARDSYDWLKKHHPDWDIDLFHARYAMGDRLDIENRVLDNFGKNSTAEQRKGKILIATQVVEQSLDADWDQMVTDLVPIDMVIQRAGRLCRHTRDKSGNRINGDDKRGQAVLHIFSPKVEVEPSKDWYADFFSKAQYIYENHGQLWLTANLLQKSEQFQMPGDARRLIEGVYGEEAESTIPEALMGSVLDAEGTGKAEGSLAKSNALKVDIGYSNDAVNHWWDEARTPTRLGEDSIILYLARWQDGKLSPWRNEQNYAWSYSSVSARTYWVNKEAISTDIPQDLLDECKLELPAKGKWGVLIPLREQENGLWGGVALNEEGENVTVQYTSSSGLLVK